MIICTHYDPKHPENSEYRDIPNDEWDGYDDKQAYLSDLAAAEYENLLELENRENISRIKFIDADHKDTYIFVLSRMKHLDCYHRSLAYLLALDTVLREHTDEVFNFKEDGIKRDGLHKGFQTGTSMKTTRLAFNLWNGCYDDGETYTDKDGYETELPSSYYTPEQIFNNAEYAPYYWEAVKIRFEYR